VSKDEQRKPPLIIEAGSLEDYKLKRLENLLADGHPPPKAMVEAGITKFDIERNTRMKKRIQALLERHKEAGLFNRRLRKKLAQALAMELALTAEKESTRLAALNLLYKEFLSSGPRVSVNVDATGKLRATDEAAELVYDPTTGTYKLKEEQDDDGQDNPEGSMPSVPGSEESVGGS